MPQYPYLKVTERLGPVMNAQRLALRLMMRLREHQAAGNNYLTNEFVNSHGLLDSLGSENVENTSGDLQNLNFTMQSLPKPLTFHGTLTISQPQFQQSTILFTLQNKEGNEVKFDVENVSSSYSLKLPADVSNNLAVLATETYVDEKVIKLVTITPEQASAITANTAKVVYFNKVNNDIFYDGSGNVGIGNTDPQQKLHVTGQVLVSDNITAYYSDERLKTFKGKITDPIEKIKQLNGYYFVENELAKSLGYTNNKVQVGVSAQEVETVLPEIVTKAPIDNNYKTVWYEKLTPLLIEGIKEQQKQIEELKEMVQTLLNK